MSALAALADRLRAPGEALAAHVLDAPAEAVTVAEGVEPRLAIAVEAIREGYLLHVDVGRVVDIAGDRDLALLAGDHLYALGLAELAEIGDLDAVRAMADVIDLAMAAHAAGDGAAAQRAWTIGTRALAVGR